MNRHATCSMCMLALVCCGLAWPGRAQSLTTTSLTTLSQSASQTIQQAGSSRANQQSTTPPTSAPVTGQTSATGQTAGEAVRTGQSVEIELGHSVESLSNGFAPWHEAFLTVTKRFKPHQTLSGTWQEVSRFSLRDHAAQLSFHQPLGSRWGALVEIKASPTHRILPKWASFAQLERSFKGGWGVQAGWRHSEFNTGSTNLWITSVERYVGNWRAAYTLFAGARRDAGLSASHLAQGNYYYSERNSFGVGIVLGRELENVGGRGIIATQVRGAFLNGRHWVTERWGVRYQLTLHQQGSLYTRKGAGFGLHYKF